MSIVQQLSDLTEDLETLLEYSQKLRAENDSIKSVLRGSVVFLESEEEAKVYRTIIGGGISLPALKTDWEWRNAHTTTGQSSGALNVTTTGDKQLQKVSAPVFTGNPVKVVLPTSTHSSSTPSTDLTEDNEPGVATRPTRPRSSPLSLFDYGKTGNERGESIVEEECCDTCDYPVLFTRRDLAAILLEHNKLQGRVAHFRSNASPYNTITPNIGEQSLKDVSVVGCQDQQNTHVFIIHATWTNGQQFELYRKYQDFFTFQGILNGLVAGNHRKKLPLRTQTFPQLPLSDHVLTVLGCLNSNTALQHRVKLVETFCKALVSDIAEREREDLYRTSVLIFFASRPGDIEIQNTSRESESALVATRARPNSQLLSGGSQLGECDVTDEVEECLGFLSSVALANDAKWQGAHSDLVNTPKPKAAVDVASNLRFSKPSSAPPVVSKKMPTADMTTERMDISRPTTTRAQVIANLSILKGTQSDSELVTQNSQSLNLLPDQSSEVCSDNGHSGNVTAPVNAGKSIRYRNQKKCSNQDLLIARMKALSVKSGSTDWGVRYSTTSIPEETDR